MADSAHVARLARQIQMIVTKNLGRALPEVLAERITVTEVSMTGDAQHATVFYTVLGTEDTVLEVQQALQASRGRFRHAVGRKLSRRWTPTVEFTLDELPSSARHMEELLVEVKKRDEERELPEHPEYAGDANPYLLQDEDAQLPPSSQSSS